MDEGSLGCIVKPKLGRQRDGASVGVDAMPVGEVPLAIVSLEDGAAEAELDLAVEGERDQLQVALRVGSDLSPWRGVDLVRPVGQLPPSLHVGRGVRVEAQEPRTEGVGREGLVRLVKGLPDGGLCEGFALLLLL